MNPETLAPTQAFSESQWIDGELVRNLMRTAPAVQITAILVVPVVFAVLWGHVPVAALGLWTAAALLISGFQLWLTRWHAQHLAQADTATQLKFMARYGFSWPLSGFIWGAVGLLHFDRTPLATQFLCWLIIAVGGSFAVSSLSFYLKPMRGYANALALTSLGVILWRVADLHFHAAPFHYWMLLLVLIYWMLLLQAGKTLHETHRGYVELHYRNDQLIESLTLQTRSALDAVTVKNRFLASAAHDIRQPVHALGLYADWLDREPELVAEIAPKIVESTKAVNTLFDSLFDLVRLDSGKTRMHIEPVDVAALLRDMELQYRPQARAKGLQLRIRSRPGQVLSDRIFLQRIVGNLLGNALKYTSNGGVLVAARPTAHGMRIKIWDTGIGIASEHHSEIFREFYKVPNHPGTEDGFGLGLSIVSRLTQRLGHDLNMKSRPGRGTVFTLTLQGSDGAFQLQPASMP
ncbi:MAG: HAMP domain-containing histidine kinase [Burkholderiaceae bacterium]|nr:MAG: HAMP domain-containing histidine kinase [Burkholderiaceae bacterium]